MKTLSINEKFRIQFICDVTEWERTHVNLVRLGFKSDYHELTKENAPENYPFAEAGKAKVIFNVDVKGIEDAFIVKKIVQKS